MYSFMSGTILSIEEKTAQDGQLICHGTFQFVSLEARGDKEEVRDELAYRCKGKPAMAIKESGMGGTGVAQGYTDLILVQMQGYKEKIPTFVIRAWKSSSIISPSPFDIADAEIEELEKADPENAPRPKSTFAF